MPDVDVYSTFCPAMMTEPSATAVGGVTQSLLLFWW